METNIMERSRRMAVAGFAMATAGILATSSAYACTVYKGKLTADGNHATDVAQTVHAKAGLTGGMNWCSTYTPSVVVQATTPSLKLDTAPTTCSALLGGSSQLRNGTYNISLETGHMPQGGGSDPTPHNCHGSEPLTNPGTTTVSAGVSSSTVTWASPLNTAGNKNVCIYNNQGFADAIAINFTAV